jgi:hypothetical protein
VSRPRGGYIGHTPTTNIFVAPGVWTLREAESLRRAGAWPRDEDQFFANVELLLKMDGGNGSTSITDSSPTPKTVTTVGSAQISTVQSRFGGASLFVNGGYLTTPLSPFAFGAGDFTIEMWLYPTATGNFRTAISNYTTFATGNFSLFRSTGVNQNNWQFANNGTYPPDVTGTTTVSASQWSHVAAVRTGNSLRLYVNGVQEATKNVSGMSFNGNGSNLWIGTSGDSPTTTNFAGYIDELRITKGVARYTADFTPPTTPFPGV